MHQCILRYPRDVVIGMIGLVTDRAYAFIMDVFVIDMLQFCLTSSYSVYINNPRQRKFIFECLSSLTTPGMPVVTPFRNAFGQDSG